MRLFLLTTLTMAAFAANSVINRIALAEDTIGPATFALIRLATGAIVLTGILWAQGQMRLNTVLRPRVDAVCGLTLYAIGFSFAYVALEAGFGALILFGVVQITMFGGAVIQGNQPKTLQWAGAVIGLVGLAYALNPQTADTNLTGALLMAGAGFGWGVYSLAGQKVKHGVSTATLSFLYATPIALGVWWLAGAETIKPAGIAWACLSGSVTSALGYILWFYVLPQLQTGTAAVAQLTVPLIAMAGGMLFLGELWTLQFTVAATLVLGGVGLSVWAGQKK